MAAQQCTLNPPPRRLFYFDLFTHVRTTHPADPPPLPRAALRSLPMRGAGEGVAREGQGGEGTRTLLASLKPSRRCRDLACGVVSGLSLLNSDTSLLTSPNPPPPQPQIAP